MVNFLLATNGAIRSNVNFNRSFIYTNEENTEIDD